jgi:hypothetical protein
MAIAGFGDRQRRGAVLFGAGSAADTRLHASGILRAVAAVGAASIASNATGDRDRHHVGATVFPAGASFCLIHQRLPTPEAGATDEAPTVQRINRRQFMMRLGATATITVAGTALAAFFAGQDVLEWRKPGRLPI